MITIIHDVTGDVYSLGDRHLRIRNLHYDGLGPDAFFIGSVVSNVPSSTDNIILPYPAVSDIEDQRWYTYQDRDIPTLPAFDKMDIELALPPGVTVDQLKYVAIWCRKFNISFGHLILA